MSIDEEGLRPHARFMISAFGSILTKEIASGATTNSIRYKDQSGDKTGGKLTAQLNRFNIENITAEHDQNWTQFHKPIENLLASSIKAKIEIGSSRQTEIEHAKEFNIRLR